MVPSARDGVALVQVQHQWLRNTFGGGTLVRQALGASSDGKRRYDLIVWRKPDGELVDVCCAWKKRRKRISDSRDAAG